MKRKKYWRSGPPRKADDLTCFHCGISFYRSPSNRVKGGRNHYCSSRCMAFAYKGRMVGDKSPRYKGTHTKPCDNCGVPITRPKWSWNNRSLTFCNTSCFGQWKANNWTGEDNPCWRGGHPPYYGANWKRQSREARRRDGHCCRYCGKAESDLRRALDVHHIVPFRLFKSDYKKANTLSNLISLCDSCHKKAEAFCLKGKVTDWPTLHRLMRKAVKDSRLLSVLPA